MLRPHVLGNAPAGPRTGLQHNAPSALGARTSGLAGDSGPELAERVQ